eukprot:9474862-Pyramimonas_sp.AAC.1
MDHVLGAKPDVIFVLASTSRPWLRFALASTSRPRLHLQGFDDREQILNGGKISFDSPKCFDLAGNMSNGYVVEGLVLSVTSQVDWELLRDIWRAQQERSNWGEDESLDGGALDDGDGAEGGDGDAEAASEDFSESD